MPRPRKPHWHDRDRCYYTKIEGVNVMLRRPDGSKVGHGDERGVREAVARLLADQDAKVRRAGEPTVKALCADYLEDVARENTSETMAGKEWVLEKFCNFGDPPYGDRLASEIDSTHLHRMRKDWEKAGYSGNMLRRLYNNVRACWAWASRPEPERTPLVILERNHLAGMKIPAATAAKAKYVPLSTVQELIAFATAKAESLTKVKSQFEHQAVLMLRLIAETGCRPKEACTATWEDFDPAEGVIVLDPTRHKTGRKTGRPRVIVVPRAIVGELVQLRDSGYAHPTHLFAHKRSRGEPSRTADRETGTPWQRQSFTAWFLRRTREARKVWKGDETKPVIPEDITLYWLRHSYLTDAQIGEGSERAADLAGNSKEIARGAYLHVQTAQLRAAAERVAKRRESGADTATP